MNIDSEVAGIYSLWVEVKSLIAIAVPVDLDFPSPLAKCLINPTVHGKLIGWVTPRHQNRTPIRVEQPVHQKPFPRQGGSWPLSQLPHAITSPKQSHPTTVGVELCLGIPHPYHIDVKVLVGLVENLITLMVKAIEKCVNCWGFHLESS